MQGKAIVAGLGKYLKHLIKLILLPWMLVSLFQVAKRHQEDDGKATMKFAAGLIIGIVLFGGAVVKAYEFHEDQWDGIYDNLEGKLSVITGNAAYEEAQKADDAATMSEHEEGHQLFLTLQDLIASRDDAAGRQLLENNEAFAEKGIKAYDQKDQGIADTNQFMDLFVYPGLLGLLFAPLVFFMGRVVNKSWTPSESVGFKPYPATSGALFLVLGAFGIPALFFAAWCFMDIQERSAEGQISL